MKMLCSQFVITYGFHQLVGRKQLGSQSFTRILKTESVLFWRMVLSLWKERYLALGISVLFVVLTCFVMTYLF